MYNFNAYFFCASTDLQIDLFQVMTREGILELGLWSFDSYVDRSLAVRSEDSRQIQVLVEQLDGLTGKKGDNKNTDMLSLHVCLYATSMHFMQFF